MVNGDYIRLYPYILIDGIVEGDGLFSQWHTAEMWGNTNQQIRCLLPKTMIFLYFPVFFREAKQAGASWIILDHLGSPSCVQFGAPKQSIPPTWTWTVQGFFNEDDSLAISPYLAIARLPENDRHIIYIYTLIFRYVLYMYNHSYYWN